MCLVHDGPRSYGSREAPVVSRLGTTLAARRSLEGDLKVVLSFPGFGGERAWKWFRARNVALCCAGRVITARAPHSRAITEGDKFGASRPRSAASASWKSPVETPRRLEDRQERVEAPRPARPFGQDRRREADPVVIAGCAAVTDLHA